MMIKKRRKKNKKKLTLPINKKRKLPANSFGARFKTIRKKQNKNQREFAKYLDVTDRTIVRYEASIGSPPVFNTLLKLKKLGVDLNWLLSGNA